MQERDEKIKSELTVASSKHTMLLITTKQRIVHALLKTRHF